MQSSNHPREAELGSIERELFVDAPPDVVYDVISDPQHMTEWWADAATYEALPGSTGTISFGSPDDGGHVVTLTVIEALRPRTFSFRWTQAPEEIAAAGNSLLVTFELSPEGAGTRVRFAETGFRERGWEAAVLEASYRDHASGWDHFLPRLVAYAERTGSRP